MSYLSRRMREEGFWRKRRPGVLTFSLEVDVSRAAAVFERASRMISDLAGRCGMKLDPWQESMVEALYVDPDDVRRIVDPPSYRRGSGLIDQWLELWPAPADPPGDESATRLPWDVVIVDEFRKWEEAGWPFTLDDLDDEPRPMIKREYLGIWPTARGDR